MRTVYYRTSLMAALAALFLLASCNPPAEVSVAEAKRAAIEESFSESARTRLETIHRITTPVDGRIDRVDLRSGDPVEKGQVLFEYDLVPFREAVEEARAAVGELEAAIRVLDDDRLEDTAMVETKAVVKATEEAIKAADEQVEAQKARMERAQKELARVRELAGKGVEGERALDDAELAAETSLIELREEQFNRAALHAMMVAVETGPRFVTEWLHREDLQREEYEQQLAQAQARLARAQHELELARNITSPIGGVVLERLDRGDRFLPAGTPVLSVGNLAGLEVIADVLTQDALQLEPGDLVELRPDPRSESFTGRVERVEPHGFTKLSSLGVEQQRVNVIVSLPERPDNLGVGYRLEARFITERKEEALVIPRVAVLEDREGGHYVFRIVNGELQRTPVELSLRSDLTMEVIKGLNKGDRIVAAPDAEMEDGQDVKVK